jgi:hypothetical protein
MLRRVGRQRDSSKKISQQHWTDASPHGSFHDLIPNRPFCGLEGARGLTWHYPSFRSDLSWTVAERQWLERRVAAEKLRLGQIRSELSSPDEMEDVQKRARENGTEAVVVFDVAPGPNCPRRRAVPRALSRNPG